MLHRRGQFLGSCCFSVPQLLAAPHRALSLVIQDSALGAVGAATLLVRAWGIHKHLNNTPPPQSLAARVGVVVAAGAWPGMHRLRVQLCRRDASQQWVVETAGRSEEVARSLPTSDETVRFRRLLQARAPGGAEGGDVLLLVFGATACDSDSGDQESEAKLLGHSHAFWAALGTERTLEIRSDTGAVIAGAVLSVHVLPAVKHRLRLTFTVPGAGRVSSACWSAVAAVSVRDMAEEAWDTVGVTEPTALVEKGTFAQTFVVQSAPGREVGSVFSLCSSYFTSAYVLCRQCLILSAHLACGPRWGPLSNLGTVQRQVKISLFCAEDTSRALVAANCLGSAVLPATVLLAPHPATSVPLTHGEAKVPNSGTSMLTVTMAAEDDADGSAPHARGDQVQLSLRGRYLPAQDTADGKRPANAEETTYAWPYSGPP